LNATSALVEPSKNHTSAVETKNQVDELEAKLKEAIKGHKHHKKHQAKSEAASES
jgi:hypothetical protein